MVPPARLLSLAVLLSATVRAAEPTVPVHEQAVWMRNRLLACGVETELPTLQGAGHGFKGASAEKADQALLAFLETHLEQNPVRQPEHLDSGRPGPPNRNRPGPWDNDVLVFRVGTNGAPEKLKTFDRAGVPTLARLKDGRLLAAFQHFPQ